MAWWDHEELKAPADRSDRYKVAFPNEYTPTEVAEAATRIAAGARASGDVVKIDIEALVKEVLATLQTPASLEAQARSWVVGDLLMRHSSMTREEATQYADQVIDRMRTQFQRWRGIFKLIEEMGELNTELGKLMAFPTGKHPDMVVKVEPLIKRVANEMADVYAALEYFGDENSIAMDKTRITEKIGKFQQWRLGGVD